MADKLKGRSDPDRARILLTSVVGAIGMRSEGKETAIHDISMGLFAGVALATLDSALMNDLLRSALGNDQVDAMYENARKTRDVIEAGLHPPKTKDKPPAG